MHSYISVVGFLILFVIGNSLFAQTIVTNRGDTMWGLAHTHYGDSFMWPCIEKANPQVKNPHFLAIDQPIHVPEFAECSPKMRKDVPNPISGFSLNNTKKQNLHETTAAKTSQLIPTSAETTVYQKSGYHYVPVHVVVEQIKRSARVKSKRLNGELGIDAELLKTLFPQDPRITGAGQ